MLLTLEEAAARLNKTVRQIRYLIDQQRIDARKTAGRWFVDLDSVQRSGAPIIDSAPPAAPPPPPPGRAMKERKAQGLRAAVEKALDLPPPAASRYSLRQLRAFQVGLPLYQRARAQLGADHEASVALLRALQHLARGCHRFNRADKVGAYAAARDEASLAVCALLVSGDPALDPLATALEQDLLPAVGGLLRRMEPRRPAGPPGAL